MYMVMNKKNSKNFDRIINQLLKEKNIKVIYYDNDKFKPNVRKEIILYKEEDLFSALLGFEDNNCLYVISTSRNKQSRSLFYLTKV